MITGPLCLLAAYALDLAIGDPPWLYHPIRLIGSLISKTEKALRRVFPPTPRGELWAGALLVLLVTAVCFAVPYTALYFLYGLNFYAGLALEILWCYQILAIKCLRVESMKIYRRLADRDISGARLFLSYIVGRDTASLDEAGICRATVETVAENTTDGVVAPMLFMAIGGAPLGFLYKAVNTMDSMIGYKNEKYLYLGKVAARLDDVFNFIPARLTAMFMLMASKILGLNSKNAFEIYVRDRKKHKSPNSAQTESVCAGALGIQLAGNAYYFGRLHEKPAIGDAFRAIGPEDIRLTNRLMYATSAIAVAINAIVLGILLGVRTLV